MMLLFSMRALASSLSPVALMRLSEISDPDELLKKIDKNQIIIEHKYDGWKVQAIKENGKVRLFSRRGEEKTENFPEIVQVLASALPDGTLAEGELVYWHGGKQDVTKVQSVAGSAPEKAREKAAALPGEFKIHLYDILWLKDKDVSGEPFSARRAALEDAVKMSEKVQITKTYPFGDWQKAMNKAVDEGGEGIVLKLKSKKYHWKPGGEREPKPADVMFKYKGGRGKSESDDYVVYDTEVTDKGALKALFGQYYKGRLYHISEISNFSAKNEEEIRKRLEKGPFVIEIGFQERVPSGLRHQKFVRFRNDKKPKDATMHEFHAKHVDNFEAVSKKQAMLVMAGIVPSAPQLISYLRQLLSGSGKLASIPGLDVDKAYKIVSQLESGDRYVVGDAGTSFGSVQVRIDSMMYALAKDPNVKRVTGLPPSVFTQIASSWIKARQKVDKLVRSGKLWKTVPVDPKEVAETAKKRGRTLKRLEGTYIRHFPHGEPGYVTVGRNGRMTGHVLNMDAIVRIPGFRMTPKAKARIEWTMRRFVTTAVVRNALARVVAEQEAPRSFAAFKKVFRPSRVNRTPALRRLVDRAAQRNFANRVRRVADAVKAAGYDTTAPNAFNIYQLIYMANAGGLSPIRRFLGLNSSNQPKYRPRPLPRGILHALRRGNPMIEKVTGISSDFPGQNGMGGFTRHQAARDPEDVRRRSRTLSKRQMGEVYSRQAIAIAKLIANWLNLEYVTKSDMREAGVSYMTLAKDAEPPAVIVWVRDDRADALRDMMPEAIYGLRIKLQNGAPAFQHTEFKENEPTVVDPLARMSPYLFGRFRQRLQLIHNEAYQKARALALRDMDVTSSEEAEEHSDELARRIYEHLSQMSEIDMRRRALEEVAAEKGLSQEQLNRILETETQSTVLSWRQNVALVKAAFLASGTLAFPGQYAEDIRQGKRDYTVRPTNMPVEPDQVVTAVTYGGSPICQIRILSKEMMSLGRIRKAFGNRMANSLEKRFGPGRRFTVIRFERFDSQTADDGDENGKWDEVLIDKNGVKLTRGQIRDHYAKPSVRKQIMSRVKGKPVLVYIGTGTNQKILKRNHNGKPIVLTSDDPSGSENPSNYWYWVKRRLLSIHEVLSTKTDHGFVDLDLHGGYPLEKAKEYATKLLPKLKEQYGNASVWQSGGEGLHIEFNLKEPMSVDKLRKELRDMLDEFNEDFENVTTGIVKGKGMRSDVSTLHNKGGLRAPGALGETWGHVKKKLSVGSKSDSDNDDDYGNNNYGEKHDYSGEPLEGGAITERPFTAVAPGQLGAWHASLKRRRMFREAGGD